MAAGVRLDGGGGGNPGVCLAATPFHGIRIHPLSLDAVDTVDTSEYINALTRCCRYCRCYGHIRMHTRPLDGVPVRYPAWDPNTSTSPRTTRFGT